MAERGILERLGHEVVFPAGQACCGQMHINSGYMDEALPVVTNHVEAFEAGEHQGELVTAEPGHGVALADARDDALRDLLEDPVAHRVAQGVVDELEAVDVHEQHAQSLAGAMRLHHRHL